MDIVLTHATALRVMRSRRFPVLPATCSSRLPDKMPSPEDVEQLKRFVPELGEVEGPVGVLVSTKVATHESRGVVAHVCSATLPKKALVEVMPGIRCVSPAMLAVLMAERLTDLELQLLLSELMGLFSPNDDFELGLRQRREPLLTPDELRRFLDVMGPARGTARVRRALEHAPVLAASPLEAKLFLRATYPFSKGGYRMGEVVLNDPVEVERITCHCDSLQRRMPDLLFKHGNAGVCLDYMGSWHVSPEGARRDAERRNELLAAGFKTYEIYKDEYDNLDYMDSLMAKIRNELGLPNMKSSRERKVARRLARRELWAALEGVDFLSWETRLDLR